MMQNQYYWSLSDDDYLAHYGIQGQKWGKRNGPPYPLKPSVSARVKKSSNGITYEGKKKKHDFEDKSQSNMSSRDKVVSNLKKSAAIGGAGIAASIASVAAAPVTGGASLYGLMALSPGISGTLNAAINGTVLAVGDVNASIANKKEKKFQEEREKNPIDKKTGFHKKTTEMTPDEDMERVNPAFKNWDKNTKSNCVLCSMSFELRRRGYDVQAKKATSGYDQSELAKDWFTGAKTTNAKSGLEDHELLHRQTTLDRNRQKEMISDTISTLKSQKDGARGILAVVWNGTTAGHSISYSVENGQPTIYDTQSNEKFAGDKAVEKYLKKTSRVEITRLDNCKLNTKYIKEVAA